MAAGPLTVTHNRERVVNFVKPFMYLGMSVLIKRPRSPDAALWVNPLDVFAPLTPAVWGLVALATLSVRSLIYLID